MRAKKGYTFDPCHGCGEVPDGYEGRKKDAVCSNCRQTLNLAKKAADDQKLRGDAIVVAIPTQSHWLPYLLERGSFDERNAIQRAFWAVALASSAPHLDGGLRQAKYLVTSRSGDHSPWSAYGPEDFRLMPAGVATSLDVLYSAIRKGLETCYSEGKKDGSNLLGQLASGGITADKFNDMALGQ